MFRDTIVENLLSIVAAYRRATGRSLTAVSKDFYGRGDFLANLRKRENSISIDRLDEMLAKFRKEWPEGEPWPHTRSILMTQNPRRK